MEPYLNSMAGSLKVFGGHGFVVRRPYSSVRQIPNTTSVIMRVMPFMRPPREIPVQYKRRLIESIVALRTDLPATPQIQLSGGHGAVPNFLTSNKTQAAASNSPTINLSSFHAPPLWRAAELPDRSSGDWAMAGSSLLARCAQPAVNGTSDVSTGNTWLSSCR